MKLSEDRYLPGALLAVITVVLSIGVFVAATARNGTPLGIYDIGIGDHWPVQERNLTIVDRTGDEDWHQAIAAAVDTWVAGGSALQLTLEVGSGACVQHRDRIEYCLATAEELARQGSDQDQGLFLPKVGRSHDYHSSVLLVCGDCGIDQDRMVVIATHELGHSLGLAHNPDPSSVMYFQGGSAEPDARDYRILRQLEGVASHEP